MNDNIVTGRFTSLAAGVQRLTAPNPGVMTGPGTNSYLLGTDVLAVIDPGPVIDSHLRMLAEAGDIRWILVTHTHPDHSPGAKQLADMTGADLIGMPAPDGPHQDATFCPDRVAADGETLQGPDFEIQMLHTPGHASNHVCYLHAGHRWLFTGDHIMNGSTVVIDPPDGDMHEYLESLRRLKQMDIAAIAPGHGDLLDNAVAVIDWIVDHRLNREAKIAAVLASNPGSTSHELVPHAYTDVDESLYGWAERSLLAHLIKLQRDGAATCDGDHWSSAEA